MSQWSELYLAACTELVALEKAADTINIAIQSTRQDPELLKELQDARYEYKQRIQEVQMRMSGMRHNIKQDSTCRHCNQHHYPHCGTASV